MRIFYLFFLLAVLKPMQPLPAQVDAAAEGVTNALRARESRIVSGFFDWKETRLVVAGSRVAFVHFQCTSFFFRFLVS